MRHQFRSQRIHVHVVELFHELRLTPDVEIVEAGLPELGQEVVRVSEWESEL